MNTIVKLKFWELGVLTLLISMSTAAYNTSILSGFLFGVVGALFGFHADYKNQNE